MDKGQREEIEDEGDGEENKGEGRKEAREMREECLSENKELLLDREETGQAHRQMAVHKGKRRKPHLGIRWLILIGQKGVFDCWAPIL